jgi:hypothetical protein
MFSDPSWWTGSEEVATGRPRWPLAASPKVGGLDMRHRLPGRLVGLAASLRSMPTACREVIQTPFARADVFREL